MCRLYGFRANEPTKVECSLILAQNSLLTQSRGELRGAPHPDGWGIAYYENGHPTVERRATAAYEDLRFSTTVGRVFARTVVAHVRQATVGVLSSANTHPYAFGPWSFAHNGTVAGFEILEPELTEEILPIFRSLRTGSNDSELAFYWLLTRLVQNGLDPTQPVQDTDGLVKSFGAAIVELAERCEAAAPDTTARLNFLLTDGRHMMASRWNRGLHLLVRDDVHDCEVCGIPHIRHQGKTLYRAVVVASEPISDEDWLQVPEKSIISVDEHLDVTTLPLA